MAVIKVRRCANEACRSLFVQKHSRNIYCCRACFKKQYMKDIKIQEKMGFPIWKCPKCKENIQLNFFPKQDYEKWKNLECPECGYRALVD